MSSLACPACGRTHGEFDAICAGCGAALPLESSAGGRASGGGPRSRPDGGAFPGPMVSRFRVLGLLGRGGMGVVYRAVDPELGREVAIKFLAPHLGGDPREEERLLQEARAAAALDHPNIGAILETGEQQGRRFLAMPLYRGETLEERLARADGPLPLSEVLSLASQLAAALAAAHAAGIVHRDLKPGNVLLTGGGRLKLLDFGLARRPGTARLTEDGALLGTAAYMAPEQLRGEEVDARTDLWAFGAVLYEALAGRAPFGRGREQAVQGVVHSILTEEPPPLREGRPETPALLEKIVRRCLSKDPAGRPAGAAEILGELGAAGLLRDLESGAFEPLPAAPAGRLSAVIAAAVAVVALALQVAFALRQIDHASAPAGPAAPGAAVQVAVLAPEIRGSLDAGSRSLLEANLQVSAQRSLTALEGIAAIDPAQVEAVRGSPRAVARAVAAGELLATAADCAGDVCQITLRRLDGEDERLLWTETLRAPLSHPLMLGEAVAAGVRRSYADHVLRAGSAALEIEEADYERYLVLRRRVRDRSALLPEVLRELEALRRRAPDFLEVSILESSLCRGLFVQTRDAAYLERGLDVARRARERAPGDLRPLFSLFDLYLADGRLAPAEDALERLEEAQPGSAGVLVRRALLLERRGDPNAARDAMALAAEIYPSWQMLLLLANLEYRLGHPAEARRRARELLERHPGSREGAMLLAQIELMEGNPGAAVPLLERLARQAPDEKISSNLGTACLLAGRFGPAEEAFRQALALDAGHLPALLGRADALDLQGRRDDARKLYREVAAAAARPGAGAVTWSRWSIEAQALAHLGEGRRAVAAIQQALRLAPDSHQLAYEAALVYALLGDRSSALFQADRALAGGVRPIWFRFSWFDPLRNDPAFAARLRARSGSRSGPA